MELLKILPKNPLFSLVCGDDCNSSVEKHTYLQTNKLYFIKTKVEAYPDFSEKE